MSRKHVERGMITLHPAGIPHGPHPGTVEASIGKKETHELAVMVDTFRPLYLTEAALREVTGRAAGSYVLSGELNAVTLDQALNIVALESKTFWRPVTSASRALIAGLIVAVFASRNVVAIEEPEPAAREIEKWAAVIKAANVAIE